MISKYHNKKTVVDGKTFDSRKEAKRYGELMLLQRAKEITKLETQVPFELNVNGIKVCSYIADFVYLDLKNKKIPAMVVEDVKGVRTAIYRLKKKLFEAVHDDLRIIEI